MTGNLKLGVLISGIGSLRFVLDTLYQFKVENRLYSIGCTYIGAKLLEVARWY
jgi:hypothetical protein